MTSRCDRHRKRRKRVRVAARDTLAHSKRSVAERSGPCKSRLMTAEERERYGPVVLKATDPYERDEPP